MSRPAGRPTLRSAATLCVRDGGAAGMATRRIGGGGVRGALSR
jgi:hypothetical protein